MGRDGKIVEGMRIKIEGQVPMFDVTTRSGQTHTFRINSIAVQSRLTCSLNNQNIDNLSLSLAVGANRQSTVGKVPGNDAEEIDKEEALQVAHSDGCQVVNEHPMRTPLPTYPQVKSVF